MTGMQVIENGQIVESSAALVNKNLFQDLDPVGAITFSGWTQEPGSNADLTNELSTLLTTPGIQQNGGGGSSIVYDLGSSKRVIVSCIRGTVGTSATVSINGSDDDITYHYYGNIGSQTATSVTTVPLKAQFIQFIFGASVVGNTINNLSLRAYRL